MATRSFLPPVADTLLAQWRGLGNAKVDAAIPGDRGESRADAMYERVLEGLHLVARHAASYLLDQVLTWRRDSLTVAARLSPEVLVLRKRLAVEKVFLQTSVQLISEGSSELLEKQAEALERLSWDWIINAEKYVEPKYAELHRAREKVIGLCADILGHLAQSRLPQIGTRFVKELDARLKVDSVPTRQEILQMCEGMRRVQLHVATTDQLGQATDFLAIVHPLKHVANVRKSQVQHALCDMLTSILGSVVKSDMPRSQEGQLDPRALNRWYKTIATMRAEIQNWTSRHAKHAQMGFPLQTLLTCLEDESGFSKNIDNMIDILHRALKDKLLRTLVLGCLCQCMRAYLTRYSMLNSRDETGRWLIKATKPVLGYLRKGNLQFPEQQDMVRQIVVTVADRAPDFSISSLVVELLQSESGHWDATMIGLRALLGILLAAPGRQPGAAASDAEEAGGASMSPELLDMIRNDQQPLAAYGVAGLTPRVALMLSRVIQVCQQLYGNQRQLNVTKQPLELVPRERAPGLPVFAIALRCVPYIMPEHWAGGKICDDLPGLTVHVDLTVRQMAAEVMRRVLRGLPGLRNAMLLGMATFLSRIPDDYPESIRESLALLDSLACEWIAIIDEKRRGLMHEPAVAGATRLDLHRLEGIALSFLCVFDIDVRRTAFELLSTLRTLHRSILASDARSRAEPTEEVIYAMNIIEEVGIDAAQQCYWDFGRWSDLWRVWRAPGEERPASEGCDFQDLMLRRPGTTVIAYYEDNLRWARAVSEVLKSIGQLSLPSARAAYAEICFRLQALCGRDGSGRLSFPQDLPGETWKTDLARCYAMVSAACPPSSGTLRPSPPMSTRELLRFLIHTIRSGLEIHQQAAVFALGYCNPGNYDIMCDEIQTLMDEYHSERNKGASQRMRLKKDEIRVQTANIMRIVAGALPPGILRHNRLVRSRFMEFVSESLRFINGSSPESWMEVQQVRYCLCMVVRVVAAELAESQPAVFTPQARRALFDAISVCCEEGSTPGRQRADMMRATVAVRARLKDAELGRQAEAEIVETSEYLEHAAALAMASLLLGPAFDAEAKRHQGRAFHWIERMLTARPQAIAPGSIASLGPSKDAVARSALRNLLSTNSDVIDVSLDQCYSPIPSISRAYFQVVAEVYATQELMVKPHVMLSLVLYKIVDPHQEVRDDALHMLDVLSMRVWKEGGVRASKDGVHAAGRHADGSRGVQEGRVAVVVGNLQDSYQQFQYQVSAKLARDHPELSELLCVEMMTRQLDSSGAHNLQHQVLTCLAPWMENLSFAARWEGNWSEQLLKSMYYVTLQHGGAFPHEIERLWSTVAANKRNIIPILDFLISRGLQEMNAQDMEPIMRFFDVGKRISLYLARISPQQAIDHLAYEITQLIDADDEPMSAPAAAPLSIYEFQSAQAMPSRHNSGVASSHEGRTYYPERTRTHSLGSVLTGASGVAGLNLLPQSLLPEFMPDISQMLSGNLRRVSELLKSASGARSDVSGSFSSLTTDVVKGSPQPSPPPSRRASEARTQPQPQSPVGRGVLMRAEVAVCLLAEVAYEHDEDFRGHLPLLFHSMLLLMDSSETLVFRHAQQVVIHLLHSLCARHLELHRAAGAMLAEYQQVSSLINYLQAMRGRRLWHYEDVRLTRTQLPSALALHELTNAILESIFFEKDLRERWAAEALRWMLDSNSRHLACRSHQVYRALRPAASSEACSALLSCLYKCLAGPLQTSLEVAVDIILTLQVMVEAMDSTKLLLYPQILLACFAILPTSYIHIFSLILELLCKVLDKLDLNDTTVQHVLLASTPMLPDSAIPQLFSTTKSKASSKGGQDGGRVGEGEEGWPLGAQLFGREHLMCVQQFLIKGLFRRETELATIEALAHLTDQVACLRHPLNSRLITTNSLVEELQGQHSFHAGLGAILGEVQAQLALSIAALLPWLTRHFRHSVHSSTAGIVVLAHARACRAAGYAELGAALITMSSDNQEATPAILARVCQQLCLAFFPRFAKVTIQRLMEVLQRGPELYHPAALLILRALFEVPGLDLGSMALLASDAELFSPVASLLDSRHSQQAIEVLNAVVEFSGAPSTPSLPKDAPALQWPRCIDQGSADGKMSTEALGRIVEGWVGHSGGRKQQLNKLMPFIAGTSFQA